MKCHKILLSVAALMVFVLAIPFNVELPFFQSKYLIFRYALVLVIAVPTAIYAVKKYRKTAIRFYVIPCFSVVLSFLVAGMFFSMKLGEPRSDSQNAHKYEPMSKHQDLEDIESLISSKFDYVDFVRKVNYYDDEERLFFDEKFRVQNDTTNLCN